MNQNELGELRRRLRPGKNNISHVYGCYVSPIKEIIAEVDQPLALLNEDDVESCLALLRKALSGGLGRNLIDVEFTTKQVAEGEEHKLLRDLRDSRLKDAALRRRFYETVIQNMEMGEDSYLILLAQESYDVPFKGKDGGTFDEASDTVYSYMVCALCPMREGKPGLGYVPNENALHVKTAGRLAAPPELGFLFPAFDHRAANLYNTLYYIRKPEMIHGEFVQAVFGVEPPLSAPEQREAFETALADALGVECRPSTSRCGSASTSTRRAKAPSPSPSPPGMWAGCSGSAASRRSGWRRSRTTADSAWGTARPWTPPTSSTASGSRSRRGRSPSP